MGGWELFNLTSFALRTITASPPVCVFAGDRGEAGVGIYWALGGE